MQKVEKFAIFVKSAFCGQWKERESAEFGLACTFFDSPIDIWFYGYIFHNDVMNGAKEMAKQIALSVICLFRVSEYPA